MAYLLKKLHSNARDRRISPNIRIDVDFIENTSAKNYAIKSGVANGVVVPKVVAFPAD